MRSRTFLLPVVTVCLLAAACKNGQSPEDAGGILPVSNVPDGWSVFEDEEFRLSVPPAEMVMRSTYSWTDGYPEFGIRHRDSPIVTATFGLYDRRSELLIRDAAELELKDYIADGGRTLAGVRVIPMRAGSCAVFTAVSGAHCRELNRDDCGKHYTLAYCDSPRTKKRYSFSGNLGPTGDVDKRPPDFAEHVANFEKILRSIEFKKR